LFDCAESNFGGLLEDGDDRATVGSEPLMRSWANPVYQEEETSPSRPSALPDSHQSQAAPPTEPPSVDANENLTSLSTAPITPRQPSAVSKPQATVVALRGKLAASLVALQWSQETSERLRGEVQGLQGLANGRFSLELEVAELQAQLSEERVARDAVQVELARARAELDAVKVEAEKLRTGPLVAPNVEAVKPEVSESREVSEGEGNDAQVFGEEKGSGRARFDSVAFRSEATSLADALQGTPEKEPATRGLSESSLIRPTEDAEEWLVGGEGRPPSERISECFPVQNEPVEDALFSSTNHSVNVQFGTAEAARDHRATKGDQGLMEAALNGRHEALSLDVLPGESWTLAPNQRFNPLFGVEAELFSPLAPPTELQSLAHGAYLQQGSWPEGQQIELARVRELEHLCSAQEEELKSLRAILDESQRAVEEGGHLSAEAEKIEAEAEWMAAEVARLELLLREKEQLLAVALDHMEKLEDAFNGDGEVQSGVERGGGGKQGDKLLESASINAERIGKADKELGVSRVMTVKTTDVPVGEEHAEEEELLRMVSMEEIDFLVADFVGGNEGGEESTMHGEEFPVRFEMLDVEAADGDQSTGEVAAELQGRSEGVQEPSPACEADSGAPAGAGEEVTTEAPSKLEDRKIAAPLSKRKESTQPQLDGRDGDTGPPMRGDCQHVRKLEPSVKQPDSETGSGRRENGACGRPEGDARALIRVLGDVEAQSQELQGKCALLLGAVPVKEGQLQEREAREAALRQELGDARTEAQALREQLGKSSVVEDFVSECKTTVRSQLQESAVGEKAESRIEPLHGIDAMEMMAELTTEAQTGGAAGEEWSVETESQLEGTAVGLESVNKARLNVPNWGAEQPGGLPCVTDKEDSELESMRRRIQELEKERDEAIRRAHHSEEVRVVDQVDLRVKQALIETAFRLVTKSRKAKIQAEVIGSKGADKTANMNHLEREQLVGGAESSSISGENLVPGGLVELGTARERQAMALEDGSRNVQLWQAAGKLRCLKEQNDELLRTRPGLPVRVVDTAGRQPEGEETWARSESLAKLSAELEKSTAECASNKGKLRALREELDAVRTEVATGRLGNCPEEGGEGRADLVGMVEIERLRAAVEEQVKRQGSLDVELRAARDELIQQKSDLAESFADYRDAGASEMDRRRSPEAAQSERLVAQLAIQRAEFERKSEKLLTLQEEVAEVRKLTAEMLRKRSELGAETGESRTGEGGLEQPLATYVCTVQEEKILDTRLRVAVEELGQARAALTEDSVDVSEKVGEAEAFKDLPERLASMTAECARKRGMLRALGEELEGLREVVPGTLPLQTKPVFRKGAGLIEEGDFELLSAACEEKRREEKGLNEKLASLRGELMIARDALAERFANEEGIACAVVMRTGPGVSVEETEELRLRLEALSVGCARKEEKLLALEAELADVRISLREGFIDEGGRQSERREAEREVVVRVDDFERMSEAYKQRALEDAALTEKIRATREELERARSALAEQFASSSGELNGRYGCVSVQEFQQLATELEALSTECAGKEEKLQALRLELDEVNKASKDVASTQPEQMPVERGEDLVPVEEFEALTTAWEAISQETLSLEEELSLASTEMVRAKYSLAENCASVSEDERSNTENGVPGQEMGVPAEDSGACFSVCPLPAEPRLSTDSRSSLWQTGADDLSGLPHSLSETEEPSVIQSYRAPAGESARPEAEARWDEAFTPEAYREKVAECSGYQEELKAVKEELAVTRKSLALFYDELNEFTGGAAEEDGTVEAMHRRRISVNALRMAEAAKMRVTTSIEVILTFTWVVFLKACV
jgi:hypothetical protein